MYLGIKGVALLERDTVDAEESTLMKGGSEVIFTVENAACGMRQ